VPDERSRFPLILAVLFYQPRPLEAAKILALVFRTLHGLRLQVQLGSIDTLQAYRQLIVPNDKLR
jgi:hypothetical protein